MLLLLGILPTACARSREDGQAEETAIAAEATAQWPVTLTPLYETPTPPTPHIELEVTDEDVTLEPLPLRAGVPFTVTIALRNMGPIPAVDVPLLVHMSAKQQEIGHVSFVSLLTVTVPVTGSALVNVPVHWNFAGGEHELSVQVNRLPTAWKSRATVQPEEDMSNNIARLEVMVDPFDAYTSDLCPGRVDIEIRPSDVLPEPDRQRVLVHVHNAGNRAAYHLPVIALGQKVAGIAYTPAIAPCGGVAQVDVPTDRPLQQGESLTVQVNPEGWSGGLLEEDFQNNTVSIAVGLPPGMAAPPGSGLEEYDFAISADDIEAPQPWLALVTVHNLGTRDAAMVPIQIENEAGRKITDAIPLVHGNGIGIAAIRIGYVWTRGGTLTFTVNPMDSKEAFPETNRNNNAVQLKLP